MKLPLRILRSTSSVRIEDATEKALAYLYFDTEETRRRAANKMTEEEAIKVAKRIARALTDG